LKAISSSIKDVIMFYYDVVAVLGPSRTYV